MGRDGQEPATSEHRVQVVIMLKQMTKKPLHFCTKKLYDIQIDLFFEDMTI